VVADQSTSMAKRGRKPSEVWQLFTLDEEKKHATCNACGLVRCKNVVTLEAHLAQCAQLPRATREVWAAAVQERKDLGHVPTKKRRTNGAQCPSHG